MRLTLEWSDVRAVRRADHTRVAGAELQVDTEQTRAGRLRAGAEEPRAPFVAPPPGTALPAPPACRP